MSHFDELLNSGKIEIQSQFHKQMRNFQKTRLLGTFSHSVKDKKRRKCILSEAPDTFNEKRVMKKSQQNIFFDRESLLHYDTGTP